VRGTLVNPAGKTIWAALEFIGITSDVATIPRSGFTPADIKRSWEDAAQRVARDLFKEF
jgi:hypothetical protein